MVARAGTVSSGNLRSWLTLAHYSGKKVVRSIRYMRKPRQTKLRYFPDGRYHGDCHCRLLMETTAASHVLAVH